MQASFDHYNFEDIHGLTFGGLAGNSSLNTIVTGYRPPSQIVDCLPGTKQFHLKRFCDLQSKLGCKVKSQSHLINIVQTAILAYGGSPMCAC